MRDGSRYLSAPWCRRCPIGVERAEGWGRGIFVRKGWRMPDFMQEIWFLALMAVLLVALIGLLLFLRNRRSEED